MLYLSFLMRVVVTQAAHPGSLPQDLISPSPWCATCLLWPMGCEQVSDVTPERGSKVTDVSGLFVATA